MARLHLVELEDQAWFPDVLRNAGTAYLRLAAELTSQAKYMAPTLAKVMRATGVTKIVDLCSGGGGPIGDVVDVLREEGVEATAVMTDLYPSTTVLERVADKSDGKLAAHPEPVDATAVPSALEGCRTLFNGFHHFRPADAKAILQNAVDSRVPIAVFEVVGRTPPALVGMLFSPLVVLFVVPFLRPFDWRWLFFTYLIPIIPFFVMFDGFVSCLRVYSVAELDAMTASLDAPKYEFETGQVQIGSQPAHVTYLIGHPTAS
jgi:hypothetical protein